MTKPAIISAVYTSYRPVPSRRVLQIVLEVPMEQQEHTFKVLGYPNPETSTWVGLARLVAQPSEGATAPNTDTAGKPPRHLRDMPRSQQAALKCRDEDFQAWIEDHPHPNSRICCQNDWHPARADEKLKNILGIISKKELDVPGRAADAFDKMLASFDYRDRA